MRTTSFIAAALLLGTATLDAQTRADTIRLSDIHARAAQRDPRTRELELLQAQSRLRQLGLDMETRPSLALESQAQYQSDVARLPIALPGGIAVPTPSNDTYDARLVAQQKLFDATRGSRRRVEGAQLAESEARVRTALQGIRQGVNDAWFGSLRAQSQIAELQTTITDLEAQSSVAATRVREGAALPSEELAFRAELLRRRQLVSEWSATRRAALAVLAAYTGVTIDSTATLSAVDLGDEVARVRGSLDGMRTRAEYDGFARTQALLAEQADARAAQDRPRVSAYARAGYGRPGLNPLNDKFDTYWLAGVQVQWSPWTWGAAGRDREVLALQGRILAAEEEHFTETLRRTVVADLATIDRLVAALASDDEIVALRERIEAETRVRFREGVVTSAEYVDRQTDVLSARVARALHRVELSQARARYLTTLGLEVR